MEAVVADAGGIACVVRSVLVLAQTPEALQALFMFTGLSS